MRIHPDVLAAHAEFGGDLRQMQALYDLPDVLFLLEGHLRDVVTGEPLLSDAYVPITAGEVRRVTSLLQLLTFPAGERLAVANSRGRDG